jgi:hypothetical protein
MQNLSQIQGLSPFSPTGDTSCQRQASPTPCIKKKQYKPLFSCLLEKIDFFVN